MQEPWSSSETLSRMPGRALMVTLALFAARSAWAQAPAGRVYVPIAPCRIVDTRIPSPNPLLANATRTFNVVGSTNDFVGQGGQAGGCGIPGYVGSTPQVQAVVFNFVAVSATGRGNLRAWPTDQTMPNASVLNYARVLDQTSGLPLNLANGIVLPVSQDAVEGDDIAIRAFVSGTDLVVDVTGYFSDFAPGQVVRSLSGQTDHVTLNGNNGLSVSAGPGGPGLTLVTVTSNATPNNVASAIVSRDGSGSFSAGTITGNLNGIATDISTAVSADTPNAVVRRDISGNFDAGTVTLAGNLVLQGTFPGGSAGAIALGGNLFLHNFGSQNTFLGANAGNTNPGIGGSNVGVGANALANNAGGGAGNSAFGASALQSNASGGDNSAFGVSALFANTGGVFNAAFGFNALTNLSTGNSNTALGTSSGLNLSSGSNNIYVSSIGPAAFLGSESNTIRIGAVGTQTATFIAGISGATSASGVAVFVNGSGQLGTTTSSRRFKDEIADMAGASDVLMKLRPVAFYYKPEYDDTRTRQYGLVAEEVAQVAPELVLSDQDGAPQTVRYHFVNAMLLNEVQKQRAQIQDLTGRLAKLEAAMAGGR